MEYAIVAVIMVVAVVVAAYGMRRVTVYEFERGLKYTHGRYRATLSPGQYWYLPWFTAIRKVDIRPRFVGIAGQEILSSDDVTLKMSLAANFEVADPNTAINKVQDFQETLYTELQLALREIISSMDIDSLLAARDSISKKLMEMTQARAQELGLRLIAVSIKDIMFPGKLKEMFAQVVGARKEGLAALRNLANAAKLIESSPALMQLRVLQAVGASSGNTLILGMPPQSTAIPIKPGSSSGKQIPDQPAQEP